MTEPERIADELVRSLRGPAWHGDALLELLDGVPSDVANARTLAGVHTVHELVLHLITWLRLGSAALQGQPMPQTEFDENWPDAPEGDDAWASTVAALTEAGTELAAAVHGLDPRRLDDIVPGRSYPVWWLLNGVTQHAAYHGGQIALLLKLARV